MAKIGRLRRLMAGQGTDSMLVSRPSDVFYLCGFSGGEGWLLVLPEEAMLYVDFRYTEQAEKETHGVKICEYRGKMADILGTMGDSLGRLGFDSTSLTCNVLTEIGERLGDRTVPVKHPVSLLRRIKYKNELSLITKSLRIAEKAFSELKTVIRPGMTEKDVSDEMEYRIRRSGASSSSFPTIVASGANASLPHHTVSNRKIEAGDTVLLDWGASFRGYSSDITRMLFLGEPDDEHVRVYSAVLEAQSRAVRALAGGRPAREIDGIARSFLEKQGLGKYFGHGLGHGVGIEVHEAPNISQKSEDTLTSGMVVTVEPGVYRRGWGGIRIEDMAVVSDYGCRVLTRLPKDIESAVVG